LRCFFRLRDPARYFVVRHPSGLTIYGKTLPRIGSACEVLPLGQARRLPPGNIPHMTERFSGEFTR